MPPMESLLEIIVIAMLGITLFHTLRLERTLGMLKRDRGTLEALITGFKLAATYAFIGVIAAEFILSTQGLGHAIAYAYNDFDMRSMYALMLLVLILSGAVQLMLLLLERRVLLHRATLGGQ